VAVQERVGVESLGRCDLGVERLEHVKRVGLPLSPWLLPFLALGNFVPNERNEGGHFAGGGVDGERRHHDRDQESEGAVGVMTEGVAHRKGAFGVVGGCGH
jgi:hypothetical protein